MVCATDLVLDLQDHVRRDQLPPNVLHAAKRHLMDTLGAVIGGLGERIPRTVAECVGLPPARYPLTDAQGDTGQVAFLLGTAAHALELDDGHLGGSVHPGVSVVPALFSVIANKRSSGCDVLSALIVGYETICGIAAAANPNLRRNGFHPTSAVGPLGGAMAVAYLLDLDHERRSAALAIAASASGGLFSFLGGGGDVKRLHAGNSARDGALAGLLAASGVSAPKEILDRPSGFAHAFAGLRDGSRLLPRLPPHHGFNILECYIKPYACCRHLQPAMDALITLRERHALALDTVEQVDVETYSIAAQHAETGWGDLASAQLSFPYCLAVALEEGRADLVHFQDAARRDSRVDQLLPRLTIRATDEMDALYPGKRPARVTVTHDGRTDSVFSEEASGSPEKPLSDAALTDKFGNLVAPTLGDARARSLAEMIFGLDEVDDARELLRALIAR